MATITISLFRIPYDYQFLKAEIVSAIFERFLVCVRLILKKWEFDIR